MVELSDTIYIVGGDPLHWAEYGRVAWDGGIPPEFRPDVTPRAEALSQRDPRWKSAILGFSSYSIGAQGCALTCAAMIARLVNPALYPVALQDLLKPAGGFWQANLNWATVPRVVPGLTFDGITNWEHGGADVDAIIAHLEQHPLILWIDYTPGGGQQSHFVLGLEYLPDFEDIVIADPWDGYTGRLLFRYGLTGWTLARAIYGMRPLYQTEIAHIAAASYIAQTIPDAFDDFPEPYKGKQTRVIE